MPVHVPSFSRRRFLQVAGASLLVCGSRGMADDSADREEDLIYVLNDTHVGEKHPPASPIPSNLRRVVTELVDRKRKPACVLINGDLALKDGQPGDYRHFADLIQPLFDAGVETHLTLGNHDNRDVFYEILREQRPDKPLVASRHLSIVETPFANLFLLDSLQKTMVTQGTLGDEQRRWLAAALDRFSSKPAIIVMHHNPRLGGDPLHFPGGLIDSQELWDLLEPRTWVKAFIHGHIHDRSLAEHRGIHIVNTPAVSYVADPKLSTTAWTTARLTDRGMTLTTHTTDPAHPWNGEAKSLVWRKA